MKMKHIQLFENFSDKTKIEIDLDGENPDVSYGCIAVGVGNNPREAAMFALQVTCNFLLDVDYHTQITDFEDFESTVEDFVQDENELEEVLQMLEKGKVKQIRLSLAPHEGEVSFFSGADIVRAEANVEKALPTATIGGYIIDSYVNELDEEE